MKRLLIVASSLIAAFSLLIARFFFIQIVEGEKWSKLARGQHHLEIKIPAKRGVFYANTSLKEGHPLKEQPLVIDVPKFHLFVDPKSIPGGFKEEVALKLSTLFPECDVADALHRKSRSRKIAMWLSPEKKKEIESWWFPYARSGRLPRNAIYFVQDYQRSYPFGKLFGQILHTICEERDPKTGAPLPTGGFEAQFDRYLRGQVGRKLLIRSPRRSLDAGRVVESEIDGADVYLSLNHYLQAICEDEIEKAVKRAGAESGYALMMEPYTGEIWALGQYPFFEPARYRDYYNDQDLIKHTKLNAAIDPVEPGSVMKPLTACIMLLANDELEKRGEAPLFDPDEIMDVRNHFFSGRSRELKDVGYHKYLNFDMAVQKSSNVYLAALAERLIDRLGAQWYYDQLTNVFNLGQSTGIEFPGESPGFVPVIGKKYPSGRPQWSKATPYSLIMGYNLLLNGFQLTRAYAIIANGGYDVKPTFIRKIVRGDEVLYANKGARQERILPQKVADRTKTALKYTTQTGGSGWRAAVSGYTEAGKTGTCEQLVNGAYSKKDHIASFTGWVPANHPRFILHVVIDQPEYRYLPGIGRTHYGSKCAAPAFREIATRSLSYLGVAPDDPYGYPKGDPRADPEKADWVREAIELKTLYEKWNR